MPGIDLDTYQRDGCQLLSGLLADEDIGRAMDLFDDLDGAAEVTPSYEAGGGLVPHRDRPAYRRHAGLDAAEDGLREPVQFELAPGDGVMWDRYFAHGSAANTAPHDRRGMVVVFADASAPGFRARDSFPLTDLLALGAG
ncbi:hypothetical protein ACWCWD_34795 [Streptomyces sp. NPDC001493]